MTIASLRDQVVETLNYNGPMTVEEIAEKLQRAPGDVRSAIAILEKGDDPIIEGCASPDDLKSSKLQIIRHG